MPRQRKKPSTKIRKYDYDTAQTAKEGKAYLKSGQALRDKAKKNSKSSLRGTDDIDYSGKNRRAVNWGNMKSAAGRAKIKKADKEQAKRIAQRNRNALSIRNRMKKRAR